MNGEAMPIEIALMHRDGVKVGSPIHQVHWSDEDLADNSPALPNRLEPGMW